MYHWEGSLTCRGCKEYRGSRFTARMVTHLDYPRRILVRTNSPPSTLSAYLKIPIHAQASIKSTCPNIRRMRCSASSCCSRSTREEKALGLRNRVLGGEGCQSSSVNCKYDRDHLTICNHSNCIDYFSCSHPSGLFAMTLWPKISDRELIQPWPIPVTNLQPSARQISRPLRPLKRSSPGE